MNKQRSFPIYIFLLVSLSLAFWLLGFFNQHFLEYKVVLSATLLLLLLLLCSLNVEKFLLITLLLLPALAGLEQYQIDVTPFLSLIGSDQYYQIDLFLVARIVILSIAIIEIIKRGKAFFAAPLSFVLLSAVALNILPFARSDFKILGIAYYWVHLVAAFGAYFLGYFIFQTKKNYLRLITVIILSSIIPVIVAVKQLLLGEFFFENDSSLPRLLSTFWHPNRFGSYLFVVLTVYLISYFAIKFRVADSKRRNLPWLPIVVLGFCLISTFSRTSWVAFAIAVGIVAIYKKEVRLPALYFGSLAVFFSLMIEKTRNRIMGMLFRQYNDTLSGRMETWDIAVYKFEQQPWTGYGPGSFNEVIKVVRGTDIGNFAPHSDLIRFLLEGGIMGIFSYVLYMAYSIIYSFKSFLAYPSGVEIITLFGRDLDVDFKLMGLIPFILFVIMIPMSFLETPTLDFIHQAYAWILLGSWLGLNHQKDSLTN